MKIVFNGESLTFEKELSLFEILKELQIENKVMAIAVNMAIVKKENWSSFIPNENDKIEALHFVGGG